MGQNINTPTAVEVVWSWYAAALWMVLGIMPDGTDRRTDGRTNSVVISFGACFRETMKALMNGWLTGMDYKTGLINYSILPFVAHRAALLIKKSNRHSLPAATTLYELSYSTLRSGTTRRRWFGAANSATGQFGAGPTRRGRFGAHVQRFSF